MLQCSTIGLSTEVNLHKHSLLFNQDFSAVIKIFTHNTQN